MITAECIQKLAYLSTPELEQLIQKAYPKDRFISSQFLGISNGGQFCYSVSYKDPDWEQPQQSKVFVWQKNDSVNAEY